MIGSQDFITLYDVAPPTEISDVRAGPGFSFQVQEPGVDAPGMDPFDTNIYANLTYRYVGPPTAVLDEAVFSGFSFLHPYSTPQFGPTRIDEYASQITDNFGGDANRKISRLGPVEVPYILIIPEPSTWLLLVVACVGVAMIRRRLFGRRSGLVALVIALAVSGARTSQAGFSAELVDIVPEGNLFRYNYQLLFSTLPGRQRLDAGNGVLAPGRVGSQDFITIYDVALLPEISGVTAGPGFTSQVQLAGVDAPAIAPLDYAAMLNVTYRYVGPPMSVSEETIFTGFSFLSPFGGTFFPTRVGQYSSQFTDSIGKEADLKISALGPVEVPASLIPEPSTWLLLVVACVGVATLRRRLFVRRSGLVALVIAFAVSGIRTSQAGFSVELVDIVPEGSNYRFNYQLIFETLPGRERIEVGNGVLAPGLVGSQDFLTIYDIDISMFGPTPQTVTAGPGFSVQLQKVGVDPTGLIPIEGALFTNATFRYVGPPIEVSTDTVFGGFSILAADETTVVTQYGSQRTKNFGLSANRKISELGYVEVPIVIPEPGTWLLLMVACVGVATLRRRLFGRRSGLVALVIALAVSGTRTSQAASRPSWLTLCRKGISFDTTISSCSLRYRAGSGWTRATVSLHPASSAHRTSSRFTMSVFRQKFRP